MTPRPGKIPVKSFRVSTRSVPRFEVTADARPPPRARRRVPPPPRARSTLNLSRPRFRSSPRAHRVRARVPTPPRAVAKSRGRVASDSVAAPRRDAFARRASRLFARPSTRASEICLLSIPREVARENREVRAARAASPSVARASCG